MRSNKLIYCSKAVWRKIFLQYQSPTLRGAEQFIHSRSSTIPLFFRGEKMKIYSGQKWQLKKINRWVVGFKFGEFTWNRRVALFKAKQLKKLKQKQDKLKQKQDYLQQKSKIKKIRKYFMIIWLKFLTKKKLH